MSLIGNLDYDLTRAATELGAEEPLRDQIVYTLAELVPYFFFLAAVLIYFSGRTPRQKEKSHDAVIAALGATLLALGALWLLGEVFFRERPFVTHELHHLSLVSPTANSLPSAHATLLFAFAGTIYFIGNHRKWGITLLVLATVVAVARVFAGVHYPFDIVAGALLGLGIGKLVSWQSRWLTKEMR